MSNVGTKNKTECCGCGACEAVCPINAIRLYLDEDGFYYPEVESTSCVGCEKCLQICVFSPKITLKEEGCER